MRREVQEKVNESATDGKGSQVKTVMDKLDLSLSLGKKKYRQELEVCQAMQKKPSTILVFEGPDAAG